VTGSPDTGEVLTHGQRRASEICIFRRSLTAG
jgi:hypothetical protein